MDFEALSGEYSQDLKRVEEEILSHLHTDIPLLNELSRYIFDSGGKRLRPLVLILAARMFGGAGDHLYRAAGAVEFLHTATLLHDDVVDQTDQRRARPTARVVWGNPASVLVGDYLLATSFRNLTALGNMVILDTISQTSALMAKGEILQLIHRVDSATPAHYMEIIIAKTASLFAAAGKIGVCCGGGLPDHQERMYRYGHDLGIAFQMVDDALDYAPRRDKVGKPQGTDLKERKVTLPLSRLRELAQGEDQRALEDILGGREITDADVALVVAMMERHQVLPYTLAQARTFATQAREQLSGLPAGVERDRLDALASFVVDREF
ncbi:MAG: polyprenyl synthetase family protein [Deltaproteobacteria bacterium]|nr:polyprenyl synthetase family protein [Deltaproteobacteria bacterium]